MVGREPCLDMLSSYLYLLFSNKPYFHVRTLKMVPLRTSFVGSLYPSFRCSSIEKFSFSCLSLLISNVKQNWIILLFLLLPINLGPFIDLLRIGGWTWLAGVQVVTPQVTKQLKSYWQCCGDWCGVENWARRVPMNHNFSWDGIKGWIGLR